MFISKGTLYFLLAALSGIAGLVFLVYAIVKPKTKPFIPRIISLSLGLVLLAVSIYTGVELTLKTYYKIKNTITALKNFPETVGTDMNRDTTDYVRILKQYEPHKYKGKVPEYFYTEYGYYDWWRFPLVYPYAIYCIDVLDRGQVANDSGKTDFSNGSSVNAVSQYFEKFMFDADYFVGEGPGDPGSVEKAGGFFIINFQNGKTENIENRVALMKRLDELGFMGERDFITVRKYSGGFQ